MSSSNGFDRTARFAAPPVLRAGIEKIIAVRPPPNGKTQQNQWASDGEKQGVWSASTASIRGPAPVLQIELAVGRRWSLAVSPDGIRVLVAGKRVKL